MPSQKSSKYKELLSNQRKRSQVHLTRADSFNFRQQVINSRKRRKKRQEKRREKRKNGQEKRIEKREKRQEKRREKKGKKTGEKKNKKKTKKDEAAEIYMYI